MPTPLITSTDLVALLPELVLSLAAMVLLLAGLAGGRKHGALSGAAVLLIGVYPAPFLDWARVALGIAGRWRVGPAADTAGLPASEAIRACLRRPGSGVSRRRHR